MTALALAVGWDGGQRSITLDDHDDALKTIGRHADVDLVVTDLSVSRRHLQAKRCEGDHVEITVCPNAQPFYFQGTPRRQARLCVGDQVIVGSTVLTLVESSRIAADNDAVARESAHDLATVLLPRLAATSHHPINVGPMSVGPMNVGPAPSLSFLGNSAPAREVARIVSKLAASTSSALLLGESGTGKTFVARLVHHGVSSETPMRVVNCAAIPEALVESELFGAERGAFSGAVATRVGAFEAAGKGTLLLDEIGELPLTSQAKLLRALEDRQFERVGSNRVIPLEARVIAATNRNLNQMVREGTFRADLLFRIGVVTVRIPSLRERGGDDIEQLANSLLATLLAQKQVKRRVEGFTPRAREAIRAHSWPGNARELRNAIEHALVLGEDDHIDAKDLPIGAGAADADADASVADGNAFDHIQPMPTNLAALEARAIEAALRATNNNKTKAAKLLGINRVTLQKKLRT